MEFLDLFSGIGGFRRGLERSGHRCIGHVEIDKYANISYMAMYGLSYCKYGKCEEGNCCRICSKEVNEHCDGSKCTGEWFAKDIKQLTAGEIPRAEIWTFGFPCTDISLSGKRAGLAGERSGLFLQSLVCSKARLPKINPASLSLRTLSICCRAREAGILPQFCLTYGKQGMTLNGSVSTVRISESPSTGNECTLLDILEESVDEKYFLSAEQTQRLLKSYRRLSGRACL